MVNLRTIRRILNLTALGIIGIFLVIAYPLYTLTALAGIFVIVMLSKQLNFYKIVMMLKRAFQNLAHVRNQIRVRMHYGVCEYRAGLEDETGKHNRSYGYVR